MNNDKEMRSEPPTMCNQKDIDTLYRLLDAHLWPPSVMCTAEELRKALSFFIKKEK